MTDIQYVVGDATRPASKGSKIIAHVCNDIGGWGAGFVVALSRRWQVPEQSYRALFDQPNHGLDPPGLGFTQITMTDDPDILVANMIAQRSVRSASNPKPIQYDALEECLAQVAKYAAHMSSSVHMPRIGCGLAGGKWGEVEPIIQRTLVASGVPVYVYDLEEP